MLKRIIGFLVLGLLISQTHAQVTDTLQVSFYNILNFPTGGGGIPNRQDTLKKIVDYLEPDIFMVCELVDASGANALLSGAFNSGGRSNYAMTPYVANTSTGNQLQNLVFYNTNKLTLYSSLPLATDLRDINKYIFFTTIRICRFTMTPFSWMSMSPTSRPVPVDRMKPAATRKSRSCGII